MKVKQFDQNLKFSVVIPVFNREKSVIKTVDSVLNQTYRNFEIIIINDGSTDNTQEVLESNCGSRAEITVISIENSGGPARPRNIGIRAASGDYVCFLDSDDIWHDHKLEKDFDSIIKNSLPDIVFSKANVIDSEGRSIKNWGTFTDGSFCEIVKNAQIPLSSSTVKKSVFEKVNFNESSSLVAVEDYLFWLEAAACGYTFSFNYSTNVDYLIHSNQLSSDLIPQFKKSILAITHLQNKYKLSPIKNHSLRRKKIDFKVKIIKFCILKGKRVESISSYFDILCSPSPHIFLLYFLRNINLVKYSIRLRKKIRGRSYFLR